MADLTITEADVALGGAGCGIAIVQVGEAVTRMMPLYKDSAGKHWMALNDTEENAEVVGISLTPAGVDGWIVMVKSGPMITGATGLTQGDPYYVSSTAGKIHDKADLASTEFVTSIGTAQSGTIIDVLPNPTGIQRA